MKIWIVWATWAVGQELIPLLERRQFPVSELRLFGSGNSAGKTIETPYGARVIQLLSEEGIWWIDGLFFAASADVSREWCPRAAEQWIVSVDKSSAFRSNPDIPLVVPEVNGERIWENLIISSPNCTTSLAAVVLWPIKKELWLRRVIMSTYQAASWAGRPAMEELQEATRARVLWENFTSREFPHNLASNLFPHIGTVTSNGYTDEEMKVTNELRIIFDEPNLPISCTSVRVPVERAHSESITIETLKPFLVERVREILKSAPGVLLSDDIGNNLYPMPSRVEGQYDVEVWRIRQSLVFGEYGGDLFLSWDQLLKGAALNGLQILEYVLKQRWKA